MSEKIAFHWSYILHVVGVDVVVNCSSLLLKCCCGSIALYNVFCILIADIVVVVYVVATDAIIVVIVVAATFANIVGFGFMFMIGYSFVRDRRSCNDPS